ncbi:YkyA family protein [Jeotgalibacillus haloalkalitolerans]|uniref:YkyA family protein n=1 Tax=Jeotgalibacillus haloalkalitolerans TaxID=3104292 RepID=A0ABU5KNR3_9BACL|nr:YkyA family protein [Jeotgalibacillus sp. HH7-29]MDZ5712899.1 YkyA family protein [Jeotgalibacillus sp. HH7-29]
MKTYIAGAFCFSAIFLSGCVFGTPAEEEISEKLEAAVAAEEGYVSAQNDLRELETEEQQLYDEIMSLSMEEFEQINSLADEALGNLEAREEKLAEERAAIESSEEEFSGVEALTEDLDSDEVRQHVELMIETMNNRYLSHEELTSAYESGIALNRELYELLKNEDLQLEELEEQITSVNDQNAVIIEANTAFNDLTSEYNELKAEYYDLAELDTEE